MTESSMNASLCRCTWPGNDPLYLQYHDEEWGVPVYDDDKLFEFLILEGAQAGLSWITVLRKRENYRRAFDGFDAGLIAQYTDADIDRLMQNAGIVRNRLKIKSAVTNARAFLEVQTRHGSFAQFIWTFVDGKPRHNEWTSQSQVPSHTPESDKMSKELKRLGFRFVGTTICYAHMQATGMVNDHLQQCFRHRELKEFNQANK